MTRPRMSRFKKPVPKWPREPLVERLLTCVSMLMIHGLMTDSEKAKALHRLKAAIVKETK